MFVTDLQPVALYVAEGDVVQLNCSLSSSAQAKCPPGSPLNLSDVTVRRRSTGSRLSGRVQLLGDDVAQFTMDRTARVNDNGNYYCSIDNTTVDSPTTHVYVLSQYSRGLSLHSINFDKTVLPLRLYTMRGQKYDF